MDREFGIGHETAILRCLANSTWAMQGVDGAREFTRPLELAKGITRLCKKTVSAMALPFEGKIANGLSSSGT